MHVHLIGVAGTGMGSLAGLLKAAGHRVTGSDKAFYPPMGPALARWGVETKAGFDPKNLEPAPDLVVVGNVCRRDHPEARAAIDGGLRYASFPATLAELFLSKRESYVVAGTHGKTTTSTLLAYLLDRGGLDPGMLVGGIPRDFGESFRVGHENGPFVVEGDEYDSAFFEKTPKMWQYLPRAAIVTSIEHDHVDIYPDEASYIAAFEGFVDRIPEDGALVAWAGCAKVRKLAERARCRVSFYALSSDEIGDTTPEWIAAPIAPQGGATPFHLFLGGSASRTVLSPLSGAHNVRNALAALALATHAGVPLENAIGALRTFQGVKRRQELLGIANGVRVYDDFAHHPTAVKETLRGLRERHPEGRLLAAFEPRSATASRALHQEAYAAAFHDADVVVLAPVGRPEIASEARLDVVAIARDLRSAAIDAHAADNLPNVLEILSGNARAGDTVVLMSNGDFGGLHDRLLAALATRHLDAVDATR
jgi:UDP-N-acetylmuramate: L-alanyl-gamma-D-glutamyl-meso-diaminopimelate ligase